MTKKRILFVDDEPNILDGLRRMLRRLKTGLDMAFVEGGRQALEAMAEDPYDVVITDMRMPGMDGIELLEAIRDRYPETIRIILTGQADKNMVLRAVNVAHQLLDKPCEAARLKLTLYRACKLHEILTSKQLKRLVTKIDKLPSLPSIYIEVQRLLADPESSVEDMANCIARDISMSAKILQLVNSAFFGLHQHITSPVQAVHILGLDTIKSLVLSVQIFSQYEKDAIDILSLDDLWQHSFATGASAQKIAESETENQSMIDEAFLGGLLHDVGKLILAENITEEYREVKELSNRKGISLGEAEYTILGASHAEVGAYLLGLWGFSCTVMEAVIYHHQPEICPLKNFCPVTAVHAANALEQGESSFLNLTYLADLGYEENAVSRWRECCVFE